MIVNLQKTFCRKMFKTSPPNRFLRDGKLFYLFFYFDIEFINGSLNSLPDFLTREILQERCPSNLPISVLGETKAKNLPNHLTNKNLLEKWPISGVGSKPLKAHWILPPFLIRPNKNQMHFLKFLKYPTKKHYNFFSMLLILNHNLPWQL